MNLLDHLGALAVAGVVTLALLSVQLFGGEAQVESTQRASGRTVVAQTSDWIERDLANIGYGIPSGDPAVLDYVWGPAAGSFRFVTLSDTSTDAHADTVRYAYSVVGRVARLDRFVTDHGVETATFTAGPSLSRLSIDLRKADGQPVGAALPSAARVDVVLEMRSLLDPDGPPVVWDQQIYPYNLIRRTR